MAGRSQFGVAIGTFGSFEWIKLAEERAIPSVEAQTIEVPYVHAHAPTLAQARNQAADRLDVENLIFLDADDSLHCDYVAEMVKGFVPNSLLQPSTAGVHPDGTIEPPHLIPAKESLYRGNWMVIGTSIPKDIFLAAEGFWEEPMWEDYSLWLRARFLGAGFATVPKAIYQVHLKTAGRNEVCEDKTLFSRILSTNKIWAQARGLSFDV